MLDDNDIQKLIKAQKEVFVTKKEFEGLIDIVATKDDLKEFVTKKDFDEFKDNSLSKLDRISEGIVPLKEEKIIKDEQDIKQKKVLEIHNAALKNNKILSQEQSLEIDKLRVF